MREARELAQENTYEYDAHPLEDNIFEWHFTVRGPKDTDFEEGRYHGRIILPNEYPFKPPELIFLTPNGRFELNTKICLSITGFHPEFWQPAWGIRTVLLAVIGFFPTEARGAIGGLDYTKEERKRLAKKSIDWICPVCQVEMKDALSDTPPDTSTIKKEELPEFMMTYKPMEVKEKAESSKCVEEDKALVETVEADDTSAKIENRSENVTTEANVTTVPQLAVNQEIEITEQLDEHIRNVSVTGRTQPIWLDALIGGLVSLLIALVCRKYVV
ncbi:hypothetical protein INT48_007296 [Thamnidium elegans]|uniref:UBC core domain-containing protein n=1 Tax=Thamnidium elegans TaxID=101142 RepID=A0A8H7SQD8_9FUNG|nr:hypothetical protein INT48_007296 [Thamnidium elegans]